VRQRKIEPPAPVPARAPSAELPAAKPRKRKLNFKETKELAELPERIEAQEKLRDRLVESLSDPAVLRDGAAVVKVRREMEATEAEIGALMNRWEELVTLSLTE
jgi:ATP-binding cassette subfamily F protein uup